MSKPVLLRFRLIACSIGIVGICASAESIAGNALGTGGDSDRVTINAKTRDPVQVLVAALEQPNRTVDGKPVPIVVELCDVDLDLTGHSLVIGADRSLIASPPCARGPRNLGPRIFVTYRKGAHKPLFEIRGDNVQFSGFRLEGPTNGIGVGDDRLETGILISPFECEGPESACKATPIHSIGISNMELFRWSGAAIHVNDNTAQAERGRLFNTNEGAVHIQSNFIHHNQHGAGYGYGVVVGNGAYALIEKNVFDENRHAIAGDSSDRKGRDFSGYTVRDNLILSGGGYHCAEHPAISLVFAPLGWPNIWPRCWRTHQIDMHGNDNAWYSSSNWQCGTAGETMIIERNTILYTSGYAIKIRGNPADKAIVAGNVFKHKDSADAISQNGNCGFGDNITNPIDVRPTNVFWVDPLALLGSCDFVGDGKEDQFMATGATWWAKSPTTHHWRYLNTMREMLPQLRLGRVDNDGTCDVALGPSDPLSPVGPKTYSRSGTGPWVPVQVFVQ